MKKAIIILSIFALIVSSCGQRNTKEQEIDKISNVYTQLIRAIETDDKSAFDELINQIPNIDSLVQVNEVDNFYSLLGYACEYKRCHLAKKLINLKADIEIGESDEYLVFDALSVAVRSQDLCLVKLLLNNGANPNRWNNEEGFTVLSLSCILNDYDISKLLIESGAKVDGVGDTGFDYIHYPLLNAIEKNNIKLVQLLIDNNCKIDIINKQNETPFTIAERNRNQQIFDLLTKIQEKTINDELRSKQNNKKTVKYYFRANGGQGVFFDDGTAFICARCDLDEDLESYKPNSIYKELSTCLLINMNNRWNLYDEYGHITIDWVIVDYNKVDRQKCLPLTSGLASVGV